MLIIKLIVFVLLVVLAAQAWKDKEDGAMVFVGAGTVAIFIGMSFFN